MHKLVNFVHFFVEFDAARGKRFRVEKNVGEVREIRLFFYAADRPEIRARALSAV